MVAVVVIGDPGAETVPAEPDAAAVLPGAVAPAGGVGTLGGGLVGAGPGKDLPHVEQARLLREGYVRINLKGLFSGQRVAVSEDIADVTEDVVHLAVESGRLVH